MCHEQSSSRSRLLEVRINASKVPIETHEENLCLRLEQLERVLKYVHGQPGTDQKSIKQQIAKAACCSRVLVKAKESPVELDIGVLPETGEFKWAFACRQNNWCSRCNAIERESRATRFAKAVHMTGAGNDFWGVVISPKRSGSVQEMLDRAEQMNLVLRNIGRGLARSASVKVQMFAAGMHTQPQADGLLWPHIHLLLTVSDDSSKLKIKRATEKWLRSLDVGGVTLAIKRFGDIGGSISQSDVKHLYQYTTRRDDVRDGVLHPAVRVAAFNKAGITKSYTASTLPKQIELRRSGFPNASVPRKTRPMLVSPVDGGNQLFRQSNELTPKLAADKLLASAIKHLEARLNGSK